MMGGTAVTHPGVHTMAWHGIDEHLTAEELATKLYRHHSSTAAGSSIAIAEARLAARICISAWWMRRPFKINWGS